MTVFVRDAASVNVLRFRTVDAVRAEARHRGCPYRLPAASQWGLHCIAFGMAFTETRLREEFPLDDH